MAGIRVHSQTILTPQLEKHRDKVNVDAWNAHSVLVILRDPDTVRGREPVARRPLIVKKWGAGC